MLVLPSFVVFFSFQIRLSLLCYVVLVYQYVAMNFNEINMYAESNTGKIIGLKRMKLEKGKKL